MKLVSNYGNSNWKRVNVQLVSLAGGLALAAVLAFGGSEILRDKGTPETVSPSTQAFPRSIGPAMDEPDFGVEGLTYVRGLTFGTVADDGLAFVEQGQGIGQPIVNAGSASQSGPLDAAGYEGIGVAYIRPGQGSQVQASDYLGMGQPGERAAVPSFDSDLLDTLWHAEVLQISPAPQLGIKTDAARPSQSAEMSAWHTALESTLIDPTDVASSFADYRPTQQFGTDADAVYASEGWIARASEAPLFGTMVDAVYVMEGEIVLR